MAESDRLAAAASRLKGGEAAERWWAAAGLRERWWRLERRPADAWEALEALAAAARAEAPSSCDAALQRALLEAEQRSDPGLAYRELVAQRRAAARTCEARLERALAVLAVYRPLPNVLAELERAAPPGAAAGSAVAPETTPTADAGAGDGVVSPSVAAEPPNSNLKIVGLERFPSTDTARVVIALNRPARFETGYLPAVEGKGPRVYVDVLGASFHGRRELGSEGLLQRVRLGEQARATRVVLDLRESAFRRVFYLPEPFRIVIDVSKEAPSAAAPAAAVGKGRRVRRVVLDPGHGGHDPGAIGAAGLREKDVTLDVAHRAAPLIARELGISTLLTRDTDDFVSLPERTARANAFGADLFISIHCNASEDPSSRGVMSFVLAGAHDADAARLAAIENRASPAAGSELAEAMARFIDPGSQSRSLQLAELLQRAAKASLGQGYADVPIHGVKRAGFYVLAGAHMPAVLFETTFISSPVDEARLDTGAYRQKLADAIVNAIRAYREGR